MTKLTFNKASVDALVIPESGYKFYPVLRPFTFTSVSAIPQKRLRLVLIPPLMSNALVRWL
jgi:hypothetical protein